MGGTRGLRLAGTALCAILLGVAALAGATTKKDSGTVAEGTTQKLTAKCPKGERVDVGGFKSTVNGNSGILIEDLFFKGARKWRASFDGLGDSAPATAIAYCADTPRLIKKTRTRTAPIPEPRRRGIIGPSFGTPLTATARCPKGTTVQLGGFAVDDEVPPFRGGGVSAGFKPAAMRTVSGRKWRVNGMADPGVELTAVAGCADLPAPQAVRRTEVVAGGESSSSAKAKCPKGDELVMGGFKQTRFNGGGPYIRALKRSGSRAWKAKTWEFDEPASLTAIAYCA